MSGTATNGSVMATWKKKKSKQHRLEEERLLKIMQVTIKVLVKTLS